jgi:hypothetical protein
MMNPDEDDMAKRRTTRKRTTRTPRRRTTRRRSPRKATRRRSVRRRSNPKFDLMGSLIAGLVGAGAGAGAYALDGVDLEPQYKALILAAGGLALGVGLSGWSPTAGAGLAGGGMALGAKMLLDQYMAKDSTSGLGRIPGYAYQKFGHTPGRPHYFHLPQQQAYLQMDAVQADLGAVRADLGATQAYLV